MRLARTLIETIQTDLEGRADRNGANGANGAPAGRVGAAPGELQRMMEKLMGLGGIVGFGGLIEGLRTLDEVARMLPRFPRDAILRFHQLLAAGRPAATEFL